MSLINFILLITLINTISSLNVDWIPADGETNIPLSAEYRESLRSLCKIISKGGKLPKEILGELYVV